MHILPQHKRVRAGFEGVRYTVNLTSCKTSGSVVRCITIDVRQSFNYYKHLRCQSGIQDSQLRNLVMSVLCSANLEVKVTCISMLSMIR